MASRLEREREAAVKHAKEGRKLIPELALLTDGELATLHGMLHRAGRDRKAANPLAYMAPQWGETPEELAALADPDADPKERKKESRMRILIEAWFLTRCELDLRLAERSS
jgi:Ser/Thr protein kinase RdoA (MazF antagonist)